MKPRAPQEQPLRRVEREPLGTEPLHSAEQWRIKYRLQRDYIRGMLEWDEYRREMEALDETG